ncbi:MAG TPA: HlyD family efflux transporter periplasmic adaptor subunit, partial [Verrucomicrobiae bacterium]|nr:HlyD family efflux transporter periplasmic adaptor subunit [Verrucomicrobiae bacterium]
GVFKVVDNLLPTYFLFKLPKPGVTFNQGDKLVLVLGELRISTKVVKWEKQGPQEGVLVNANSFVQASLGKRKIGAAWVDKAATGFIIPAEAVMERQGKKGIFIVRDGIVKWQEVKLLAQYKAQACVKDPEDSKVLKAGDSVVANPSYAKEGQIIKK